MIEEKLVALSACFFTAEKCKHHGPFGFSLSEVARKFQHRHATGSVILRAVVNFIAIKRLSNSQMVEVSRKKNNLLFQLLIMAWKDADHIAGMPLPGTVEKSERSRDILNVPAMIACRLNAEFAKLGGQINGRKQFVSGAASTAPESIIRQKRQLTLNVVSESIRLGLFLGRSLANNE